MELPKLSELFCNGYEFLLTSTLQFVVVACTPHIYTPMLILSWIVSFIPFYMFTAYLFTSQSVMTRSIFCANCVVNEYLNECGAILIRIFVLIRYQTNVKITKLSWSQMKCNVAWADADTELDKTPAHSHENMVWHDRHSFLNKRCGE